MKTKKLLFIASTTLTPFFALAAPDDFAGVVYFILDYIGLLIPFVVILTLAVFFWGLVRFILRVGGNESEIENGKNLMIYGIAGLFVMVSLWAIVSLVAGEFNFGSLFIPQLPEGTIRGVDDVPQGEFPSA